MLTGKTHLLDPEQTARVSLCGVESPLYATDKSKSVTCGRCNRIILRRATLETEQ